LNNRKQKPQFKTLTIEEEMEQGSSSVVQTRGDVKLAGRARVVGDS